MYGLRFLADPFYETRLINQSILQTTAQQYLHPHISSEAEQVKYLIDNGIAVKQDLQLALGVALSQAQINRLKKDMVWYVEKNVNGQKVLAPQLYLAQATINKLGTSKPTIQSHGPMHLDVKHKVKQQWHHHQPNRPIHKSRQHH